MKKFIYTAVLLLSLVLTSCGGYVREVGREDTSLVEHEYFKSLDSTNLVYFTKEDDEYFVVNKDTREKMYVAEDSSIGLTIFGGVLIFFLGLTIGLSID